MFPVILPAWRKFNRCSDGAGAVWAVSGGVHDTSAIAVRDTELVRMSRSAFEVWFLAHSLTSASLHDSYFTSVEPNVFFGFSTRFFDFYVKSLTESFIQFANKVTAVSLRWMSRFYSQDFHDPASIRPSHQK